MQIAISYMREGRLSFVALPARDGNHEGHKTKPRSPHHERHKLACGNLLAVWGDDNVAIRLGSSGDISGTLPGDEFDLRALELAGKDGGKETLETWLDADLGFQLGIDEHSACAATFRLRLPGSGGRRVRRSPWSRPDSPAGRRSTWECPQGGRLRHTCRTQRDVRAGSSLR